MREEKKGDRIMSRSKTAAVGPVLQYRGKSLKRRVADNWQLYLMLLVPVILTIIYKYIPMYGIQTAFRDYKASKGFTEANGLAWNGLGAFSVRRLSGV